MISSLEDFSGSREALQRNTRELHKRLRNRGILFGDDLLPTYGYPVILAQAQHDRWVDRAERLVTSVEHLARRIIGDPALFDSLGLRRDGLDLIQVEPGYERICVLCRPDGIPIGSDIKFVELNCDSPAMMMFLDIVAECMLELDGFASLKKPPSAAARLLQALLDCYREYGGKNTPTIAIVDWQGQKTRWEHLRLAECFEARGYPTVICDPRSLRLRDGKLETNDRRIDLVYRRALASEMFDRRAEIEPLLTAYRNGTVCMVNPLRSYVASAKAVLSYLALNGAADCVPRTLLLESDEARESVRREPSRWVLKKSESHGGEAVVLPDPTNGAWNAALDASRSEMWIAQQYVEVPQISIPELNAQSVVWASKYYNWNPFVFGGQFAGGLIRVSSTPLINICLGGGLLPTFTA